MGEVDKLGGLELIAWIGRLGIGEFWLCFGAWALGGRRGLNLVACVACRHKFDCG